MRKAILSFLLALELALFLGAFYEPIGKYLYPNDAAALFQDFVKFQFVVLAFLVPVAVFTHWAFTEKKLDELLQKTDAISSSFAEPFIYALQQEDFYQDFRRNVAQAKKIVDITHLDTLPPGLEALDGSASDAYYSNFVAMVKNNPNTLFRRVERYSKEKHEWIQRLIDGLGSAKNFSLRCMEIPGGGRKTPHMSVQIIDKKICYLVAISRHTDAHYSRDVKIVGEEISQLWLNYYNDTLWEPAVSIIDHGRFDAAAWGRLKQ